MEFVLVSPTGCLLQNVYAVYGNHPPQLPVQFYNQSPTSALCSVAVQTPVYNGNGGELHSEMCGPKDTAAQIQETPKYSRQDAPKYPLQTPLQDTPNYSSQDTPKYLIQDTPKLKSNVSRSTRMGGLPQHVFFEGNIDYPIESIVDEQLVARFALDRNGCQYLQDAYVAAPPRLRKRLFNELMKNFEMLSCDVFANFLMQTVVSMSNDHEKNVIVRVMRGRMIRMCYNRYACRVVQQIIETAFPDIAVELMSETAGHETRLSVDQNANHVVQKFLHALEPHYFAPMISSIASDEEELRKVMKNKYGCRVIQLAFERLSHALESKHNTNKTIIAIAEESVSQLIVPLLREGAELVTNEYSNYVVQYVITAESFHLYRDQIIREHVLGNLLALSVQKFSSHVVEKAFRHAPTPLLYALFNEVFTNFRYDRMDNTIDTMMFDQFGNYVVQVMLEVVLRIQAGERNGSPRWLPMLVTAITRNECGLVVYSSGKRLLDLTIAAGVPSAMFEQPQPIKMPYSPAM